MEFHENRPQQPFIGYVFLVRAVRQWLARRRTERVLRQMSDEQLKDVGLTRRELHK